MWACSAGTIEWLSFFYLIWIKDKRLEATRSSFGLPQKLSVCFIRSRIFKTTDDTSEREDRSPANVTKHHLVRWHFYQTDIWLIFISCGGCKLPWAHAAPKRQQTTGTFSVDYAVKSLEWPAAKKKLGHSGHREYKLTDKPFQVYLRCRCNGDVVFRLASRLCDLIQRCNLTNSLQFVKDWTETRARARRPTSTDPLTRLRNDTKKLLNARVWKSFRRFISEREDLESDKKPGGALVVAWGPSWNLHPRMSGH